MKLKRLEENSFDWEALKDAIKKGALKKFDLLEIDGKDWKVLDVKPGEIFIWQCHGLTDGVVFNKDGSNRYEGSDIQRHAREVFPKTVPDKMLELVTEEGFNPLSIEEIKQYLPTEYDRIATDESGDTAWWWSRSASRGYAGYTWYVNTSGYANHNYAYYANRFAPACHLKVN